MGFYMLKAAKVIGENILWVLNWKQCTGVIEEVPEL